MTYFFFLSASQQQKGQPPKFTSKPSIRQEGKNIVFEVKLTADPAPKVTWSSAGKTIKEGGRYKITTETSGANHVLKLVIIDAQAEDGGEYKVNAKNDNGESNANLNLNFDQSKYQNACILFLK